MSPVTIDIDTGGTFTDGFITRDGQATRVKVETTPHDLTVCFLDCIKAGADKLGLSVEALLQEAEVIRYSTTVGTNTLIQRKGPKVGLLVTKGYEASLYGPGDPVPHPLRPFLLPDMVVGIHESTDEKGQVKKPLDEEEVRLAMEDLLDRGARILVVSFLYSEKNPVHEKAVKAAVTREYPRHYLGSVPVVLASDLTSRPGTYERTNTAVLSAYLRRDMVRYLYKADEELAKRGYEKPLLIVHSSGGAARVAKTTVLDTYDSGPTAGVLGAANIVGKLYGIKDFVSVDVGGTSIDIGVVRGGQVAMQMTPNVEGIRIAIPMVEVHATGGGGGAIVRVDKATNTIHVGPESAGALPGPACYNLGGMRPTVTDADVILGYLNPDYFLGGRRKLHKQKAVDAIRKHVAEPLGISVEEAAFQVVRTAEQQGAQAMAAVLKAHGVRGTSKLTLLVFGGAGGTRCCAYADTLGMSEIYVFAFNAVFCAAGSSTMDVVHLYEHYQPLALDGKALTTQAKQVAERVQALKQRALVDMRGEGFPSEKVRFRLEVEVSEGEQEESRLVESSTQLTGEGELEALAQRLHGSKATPKAKSAPVVLRALRLRAISPVPHHGFVAVPAVKGSANAALKATAPAFWGHGFVPTPRYDDQRLEPGSVIGGPAIVEADDTTYVVAKGWQFEVDRFRNAKLSRQTR